MYLMFNTYHLMSPWYTPDRLCGLLFRVPDYRSRGLGFDSRRYKIFWEVVGVERDPLSLVRIIEELLEWKSSNSDLENQDYGRGNPLRWPRDTLYPQKLALTSPTSGGRSVCIVRLRTKTMEFSLVYDIHLKGMTVGQQDGVVMKSSRFWYLLPSAIFYPSPSRKISVQCLKLDHDRFVVTITFLIYYSLMIL
jgi:hypothetical protein